MACTTPTPAQGDNLLPLDRLEEIDTTLYHFEHILELLSTFAAGGNKFTDGIQREHYAAVFGWIGSELHDIRVGLNEVHKWVAQP